MNPVDFMIDRTGMSRIEFSLKHGFGKNILGRVVQGRLQSVTPRISSALWSEWRERGIDQDEFDERYGTLDVDTAYQKWVRARRKENVDRLPWKVPQVEGATPFGRFVKAIGSVSRTAQVLVVADVVVQRYADGRQKEMPGPVKTALTEMGYPYVESLEKAQKAWNQNA